MLEHLKLQDTTAEPMRRGIDFMTAHLSNEDAIACKGKLVMLVRTSNGGGSQHYAAKLEVLGHDVVDALAEQDIAFDVLDSDYDHAALAGLIDPLLEGGILDVELRFYQFGSLIARYATLQFA